MADSTKSADDTELARQQYTRYCQARDRGHTQFVEKAEKCRKFVVGKQWEDADLGRLQAQGRPALTINKTLSTLSTVLGEQINNRAETSFRPRNGSRPELAEVMTKVYKQISDNNQLMWKRSDVFASGLIASRGFLDVRIDNDDSMQGEVRLEVLNPVNVVIDPDAEDIDPDTWNEVFVTKWLTLDDIEILYGKAQAEKLYGRESSEFMYGYDSIDVDRQRFGTDSHQFRMEDESDRQVLRNVRVIERQYRKVTKVDHFVNPVTGDTRMVPSTWSKAKVAEVVQAQGLQVIKKLVRRIRWTVTADDVVLHDDWSPYNRFTVVPYFPYFFSGETVGLIENLLSPQEMLNKVSSQELHVINTTANSGWKVKSGALVNMTIEELEQKGARTGSVFEVMDMEGLEKIQPNQVPTGLDRLSFKAEESIKSISGVNDSMQGFDREDVAARAIQAKRQAASIGMAKPLDNLGRSDYFLARAILDLVQQFYTEERILTIVMDETTGQTEELVINQPTPEGQILNDLTLGEYGIVITSVPHRETLEDSQFEQALALREVGITLPDNVLIEASRLQNKREIILQMQGNQNSPEAQAQAQLQQRAQEAEIAGAEAKAQKTSADAGLSQARTQEVATKTQLMATGQDGQGQGDGGAADAARVQIEGAKAEHQAGLEERKFEHQRQMDHMKFGADERARASEQELKATQMRQDRELQAAEMRRDAAVAAQSPRTTQPSANPRSTK